VQVRDQDGQIAAVSQKFPRYASSPQLSQPVVVRGQRVGQAIVRFPGTGLGAADAALRTALWRAIAGASGRAALVAVFTGLAVAPPITRPVGRLIAVTRAMGHGDRAGRGGPRGAPGGRGGPADPF